MADNYYQRHGAGLEKGRFPEGEARKLIDRSLGGDKEAQDELVLSRLNLDLQLAEKYREQAQAAGVSLDDLIQEGITALLEFIRNPRGRSYFQTPQALIESRIKSILNREKKRKAKESAALAAGELGQKGPESLRDGRVSRGEEIKESLGRLPAEQREILIDKYLHNLTWEELGISRAWGNQIVQKARREKPEKRPKIFKKVLKIFFQNEEKLPPELRQGLRAVLGNISLPPRILRIIKLDLSGKKSRQEIAEEYKLGKETVDVYISQGIGRMYLEAQRLGLDKYFRDID